MLSDSSIHAFGGNSSSPPPLHSNLSASRNSPEADELEQDMANFPVNPTPFVPDGLEIEDWARPARGKIIISGNPPRQHEDYAIVTVRPPPRIMSFMMQWMKLLPSLNMSTVLEFSPAIFRPWDFTPFSLGRQLLGKL
jgi:hypothetical protein